MTPASPEKDKKKGECHNIEQKAKNTCYKPRFHNCILRLFQNGPDHDNPNNGKGIVKEVKNMLPVPSQKERKISMLISPNIGLRIPLKPETPLDFTSYYPKVLMYSR